MTNHWKSKRGVWDWRKFLTAPEAAFVDRADKAASKLRNLTAAHQRRYGAKRTLIVNRALHRAKYAKVKAGKA